ncbi:MAG: NADP-dependent oxidoreductase [Planctomycetaceae bacterium]|nr:NADP-dependent oxidoreductase [Planctomycetaceae bacterium]
MTILNHQVTLKSRPVGFPQASDFDLIEVPLSKPGDGEILIEAHYLSVDPYMRGRMNDAASYADPVRLGEVMVGESVGRVIESRNPKFPLGTFVSGMFGWQEYAISDGKGIRRIDPAAAPISTALHVLGMPGMTAYFGLLDVCGVKKGETVFVSGAAGAVGSIVGQLAVIHECRAVGSAGSDDKLIYMTDELGYDAAFNYKAVDDLGEEIRGLCPEGIDVYFDNVGGPITDAVFPMLNVGARVAICGQISQYNLKERDLGPRLFWHLIVKRATVRGFLVFDFASRYREALTHLTEWYQSGRLKMRERITDGIENAPHAFIEMLHGANTGKQLVRLQAADE